MIRSALAPDPAYLTQSYEPSAYRGGTIQRQAPWGVNGARAGEYRVTAPDGADLGWAANFASAMVAIEACC